MTNYQFNEQESLILENILRLRRDVRGNHFTQRPVSDKVIDKLLYSASLAPSVGFSQPWEFVVIRDPAVKRKIADNFKIQNELAAGDFADEKHRQYQKLKLEGILEAPVNLAVFYSPARTPVLGQHSMKEMGEYSVVCAVQNIWLMARSLNIGVGWVSILDPEQVKATLQAPKENKLIAYLCIGYVNQFLENPELEMINWERRKQMENLVHENCYAAN